MPFTLNAKLCQTSMGPVWLHMQISDESELLVDTEVVHGDFYSEADGQEQSEKYK